MRFETTVQMINKHFAQELQDTYTAEEVCKLLAEFISTVCLSIENHYKNNSNRLPIVDKWIEQRKEWDKIRADEIFAEFKETTRKKHQEILDKEITEMVERQKEQE